MFSSVIFIHLNIALHFFFSSVVSRGHASMYQYAHMHMIISSVTLCDHGPCVCRTVCTHQCIVYSILLPPTPPQLPLPVSVSRVIH